MALITRLSRLVRADLHAVLDRIEEPDVLLRQAIREMEEALADDQQRASTLQREHGQVAARVAELDRQTRETEGELDVCFDAGKQDLARTLVRRRLEIQRLLETLGTRRAALEQDLDRIRSRLDHNRARLVAMRQAADVLTEDEVTCPPLDARSMSGVAVSDADVEDAWLREQQRRHAS